MGIVYLYDYEKESVTEVDDRCCHRYKENGWLIDTSVSFVLWTLACWQIDEGFLWHIEAEMKWTTHFADDFFFKRILVNENVWISIKISLKFVPESPINNSPALAQKT